MSEFSSTGYEFSNASGRGTKNKSKSGNAYKPLVIVPVSNRVGLELHVHLECDADFGYISGWNIKNTGTGRYETGGEDGRRALTANEKLFLNAKYPGWNRTSSYPSEIKFVTKKLSEAEWRRNLAALAEKSKAEEAAQAKLKAEKAAIRAEKLRAAQEQLAPMKHAAEIGTMTRTTAKSSGKKNGKLSEWSKKDFGIAVAHGVSKIQFSVETRTRKVTANIHYQTKRQGDANKAADSLAIKTAMKGESGLEADD